jgi:23S rRNA (guanine2445-N2)-methyltransferase / 23S rRNA (guanine2069-N7)-methyltransferase
LCSELQTLGLPSVETLGSGVQFGGGLRAAYQACLHSRVANRVLWPLHQGKADSPEDLYALVREIDWSEHVTRDGSLAVDFYSAHSTITHTQFGALKVKDAVVDQFREATGVRPDVERQTPDVRINVYVHKNKARIALDLSGSSLHRRGYRGGGGPAPLKENLAAALLLAADWPRLADSGAPFVDPMCGSGTLLIEAACMAAHRAPGLGRDYFGFFGWLRHDQSVWQDLVNEAQAAVTAIDLPMRGMDRDAQAVQNALAGLAATALTGDIQVEQRSLEAGLSSALANTGLVISNPPWGERLAADAGDYRDIGHALSRHFPGWDCGLFTAREAPFKALQLPLSESLTVVNGGLDCRLSLGVIPGRRGPRAHSAAVAASLPVDVMPTEEGAASEPALAAIDARPFVNRLKKNLSASRGWRRQQGIRAHRVYDADLPEFAVAIDLFDCGQAGDERHLVVQEYAAPRSVNAALAADRLDALLAVLPEALETAPTSMHIKTRERQRAGSQYQRRDAGGSAWRLVDGVTAALYEQGIRYELNFTDYLDVGLFLDHRRVRHHLRDEFSQRSGGRFLNLFAYTGSATLAAIAGGAAASVSVDLSRRYTDWAERNLRENGADAKHHQVVRADVMTWLAETDKTDFSAILLDPPTHSNSTSTDRDWDVQKDHVVAIDACMQRLAPDGLLVFSNNFRNFRLDTTLQERYHVEDRSTWSLSRDFKRNTRIHRCWFIKRLST